MLDTVTTWSAGSPRDPASDDIDPEFVGVCLDTCHLAVSFADPADAVRRIAAAGLRVVKVQASAALHVERPSDAASRDAVAAFVEQRYLHQTRELRPDGRCCAADDLPEALEPLPAEGPWRVHFHVPLHLAPRRRSPPRPTCSRPPRRRPRTAARRRGHLDVETYTWTVLPPRRPAGDAGELRRASPRELRCAARPTLLDPSPSAEVTA